MQDLLEAPVDDFDDSVLLGGGHFVVAGEAEAAVEDVGTDIRAIAGDVGIGAGTAAAVAGDEGVASVDGLQVHGLPDRAALGIEGGQGFQDLRRAGLAGFGEIEGFAVAAYLAAHSIRVDEQTAEPEVGYAVLGVIGIHADREVLQALFIALVDGTLLRNMLVKKRDLAADDAGNDVGHTIVVANLFVLIPRCRFAGLSGPFADLIGIFFRSGQEEAARGAGDDFIAVEGDAVVIAECTGLDPLIGKLVFRAEALGRVLDKKGMMSFTDVENISHLAGGPVEMGEDDKFGIRV